jgi:hypothetical protein
LTNSGSQVLDTLEVSHPIARFIVDNAKSQGSGATAFVLILAALVREVVRHISTIRDSEQLRELSSLGRAFATIQCQWLDAIVLPELLQAAVCTHASACWLVRPTSSLVIVVIIIHLVLLFFLPDFGASNLFVRNTLQKNFDCEALIDFLVMLIFVQLVDIFLVKTQVVLLYKCCIEPKVKYLQHELCKTQYAK